MWKVLEIVVYFTRAAIWRFLSVDINKVFPITSRVFGRIY